MPISTGLKSLKVSGHRMYALSDPLTVPTAAAIPEPSTLALLVVGIGFVCGIGIRQRKKAACAR